MGIQVNGVTVSPDSVGVRSFNGRTGAVSPQSGDYTASMVGAVEPSRKVNGKALSSDITLNASDVGALPISGGTLTGNLTLKSGNYGLKINLGDGDYVHLYENEDDCLEIKAKKINFVTSDTTSSGFTRNGSSIGGGVTSFNGRTGAVSPASGDYTAAMVSAVPTSRTVNGKSLSSNISLTASDIGALSSSGGTISGNLTIKGSGNYGTKINLGDGDYVHIAEPTDDNMEIKAKTINFVTSNTPPLQLNGSALISCGTSDLTSGSSTLAAGSLYGVYA